MRGTLCMAIAFAFLVSSSSRATSLPAVSSGTQAFRLDAAAGVTVNGSSVVTNWADQSGNGNHATLNAGNPLLVNNAIGGKPAVRFTYTTNAFDYDYFDTVNNNLGTNLTNSPFTIFAVTRDTTTLNGLFDSQPGTTDSFRAAFGNAVIPPDNGVSFATTTAASVASVRFSLADKPGTGPTTPVRLFESFLRGSAKQSAFSAIDSSAFPTWNNLKIGVINGGGLGDAGNLVGDLAELVIYKGALTDADRLIIENALGDAYGVVPEPATGALLLLPFVAIMSRRDRSSR